MIAAYIADSITAGRMRVLESFLTALYEFVGKDVVVINTSSRGLIDSVVPEGMKQIDFKTNEVIKQTGNWPGYIDACKKFLVDNGITTMFIIGSTMVQNKKFGDEHLIAKDVDRMQHEVNLRMNFVSMRTFYTRVQFVNACSQVCKHVYHQVVDPQEPDYSRVFDFNEYVEFVDLQFASRKRVLMPYYEWYSFKEDQNSIEFSDRNIAFTFGASAVTADRHYLIALVNEMKESFDKEKLQYDILLRTKVEVGKSRSMFVDQRQYVYDLQYAAATIVVPAYDAEAFSWFRFIESAARGCVPLVYKECQIDSIKKCYPETYEVICDELVVNDVDDIVEKVKKFTDDSERTKICKKIQDSIASRHVFDIQWLHDRWHKLQGVSC